MVLDLGVTSLHDEESSDFQVTARLSAAQMQGCLSEFILHVYVHASDQYQLRNAYSRTKKSMTSNFASFTA